MATDTSHTHGCYTHTHKRTQEHTPSRQPANLETADTSVARGSVGVWGGGIQSLSLHRCTHTHIPSPGSVSCIAACLSWQMWPSDQTLTNSCLVIRGCWWGGERGGESQAGAGSGTCCGTERQRSVCTAQEEA